MTQTTGVTEESVNFFRIISLVVDVGSDCLRDLLTTLIPVQNLANELQANIMVINRLHKAGVLHQDQYVMLMGPNPNPEEFDISLLVVLLRNICPNVDPPVGGWIIKTPDVNDFSLGAELLRLRNIRNTVYAHRTSTRLTETDFQSIWKELTECILRISKHGSPSKELEIQKSINEMKNRALNPLGKTENAHLKQFQKWQKELDETIQTAKQEIIEHIDKEHEKLEESYERLKQVQEQVSITNLQMLGLQKGLMNTNTLLQLDAVDPKEERSTELQKDVRSSDVPKLAPEIEEQDAAALQRQCVTLIKLYPWLKDEMDKTSAVVIASKVLSRDHTETIFNSSQRRMAVDMLLKIVLKNKYAFLSKFFGVLKDTWNLKDVLQRKLEDVIPTESEVKAFIRLNDNHKLSADTTRKQCVIEARDKEVLVFQVKDIVTIDSLNNNFLSRLLFSLQDHDSVCDYLHNSDLSGGARCLINNMEKCSASVMQTFCEIMTSQRMGYVIQALDFQRRYCQIGTDSFAKTVVSSDEHYLYFNAVKTFRKVKSLLKEMIGFMVTGIDYGSVVYHLSPTTERSWKQLEEKCVSGQLLNIFEEIFVDEDVNAFLVAGEYRLQFTIYSLQCQSHQNKVQRTACLKLNLMLGNLNITNVRADASADPFQQNIDILCDELELSDELIELLKRNNMVTDDVAIKLRRIESRAARIKYLLTQIPHSEKGYQTVKDYIKQSNNYLYQQIDKKDNEQQLRREIVHQCETKLKSDVSDFEMRFKFHSENEFPFPEPLSQATKTYPSRRARNNAASSRDISQRGRTWVTVAC